ncbi:MAG: hypothetical protein DME24_10005 [Verrucomicrobia bacterium]|nr:MAG: hypothetical protein DME24_10005 [Verrucomicrobiota bacterium]
MSNVIGFAAAVTFATSQRATRTDQKFRLYIAFVYGLRFLGQKEAKRGKRRIAANVGTTRRSKTSITGPNSFSKLQNRCSTTELRWRCEESKSAIPQIVNEPFCIPWLRNWTGRPGSESQNPPRISVLKLDDFAPVIVGVFVARQTNSLD